MSDEFPDIAPLWLTLRLALISTLVLLLLGTPAAWWLARTRSRLKSVIEAVVGLPLVLPPTVLGFYLLIFLSSEGWLGTVLGWCGVGPLTFTFTGLVIGSVLYSLPFVVQPLQGAFESLGESHIEAAATLRASGPDRFFTVALPLSRRAMITAAVLGFAHTVGEFGVVLMIGGNIPGKTRTLSISIYNHVEALEYSQAHFLSLIILLFSFLLLLLVYGLNRRRKERTA
ncbi:molybdate ABC transporter permease subunit [Candidatus Sumerlaeota bacterium]|nr:molybdate ABC transporter permease subunit [Candidatus Sumerlaeota bacterium]